MTKVEGLSFDNMTDNKGRAFILKLRNDGNLIHRIIVPFDPATTYKDRIKSAQTEMNKLVREKIKQLNTEGK